MVVFWPNLSKIIPPNGAVIDKDILIKQAPRHRRKDKRYLQNIWLTNFARLASPR